MTQPAANEAEAVLSAGARLAQARERLGLSQEQVADKLKLDTHTVVALEAGDYRVIGAAVFVRGFLRRYAQLVGDSPAEIEALYARQPGSSLAPDLARIAVHSDRRRQPRKAIGLWPFAAAVRGGRLVVVESPPRSGRWRIEHRGRRSSGHSRTGRADGTAAACRSGGQCARVACRHYGARHNGFRCAIACRADGRCRGRGARGQAGGAAAPAPDAARQR